MNLKVAKPVTAGTAHDNKLLDTSSRERLMAPKIVIKDLEFLARSGKVTINYQSLIFNWK